MTSEPQKIEPAEEETGTTRYKVQITKTHEVVVHATSRREARALVDKYCWPLQNGILYTISVDIKECPNDASIQADNSHSGNVAS